MNIQTGNAVQYERQAHHLKRSYMPELNERLREARASRSYSQEQFAEVLSAYMKVHETEESKYRQVSQAQISKWERGEVKSPGIPVLKAMSAVLDVTLDYLLGLVDDPHSHLIEEGLSDKELLLVRRVRQHPELASLLYKMLDIELPLDSTRLGSGTESRK